MLSRSCRALVEASARAPPYACITTSAVTRAHQPNAPLDLDPSMKALLQDIDTSLLHHRARNPNHGTHQLAPRELELMSSQTGESQPPQLEEDERTTRKSPAARFGSQRVGAIVLPDELQKAITTLVEDSDKHRLRSDAIRLFKTESTSNSPGPWDSDYDVNYRSRLQASRHAERDGTAFATVALPAHYSAIYSVLSHARQRLGPKWTVNTVYDWGCGTGSALWASSHVFQDDSVEWQDYSTISGRLISDSWIDRYIGIDKRSGLMAIGKRLLEDVDTGRTNVTWCRSLDQTPEKMPRQENTLAISSFLLSALPTDLSRKALIKEMWNSGADTIVLIDHSTKSGFASIVGAREYLLKLGNRAVDTSEIVPGSFVVAPCPHDGQCPLFHDESASRLVCGFSQRMQRPSFVRKTKHSGIGHEDIGYSYVVIRRGVRPSSERSDVGRLGGIAQQEQEKEREQYPMVELQLLDGTNHEYGPQDESTESMLDLESQHPFNDSMRETLRQEAFQWPRLIFPPLKRSGHIILDTCSPQGKIMRMTIPKSQGKQPYYDARKSEWGDLFPHSPKNQPQLRFQPTGLSKNTRKQDKRSSAESAMSYGRIGKEIRSNVKALRKERKSYRDEPLPRANRFS